MSVDTTVYLVFGVKIDPELVDWEEHVPELEGQPVRRFDIVYDNMCGDYAIAGKMLASADEQSSFDDRTIIDIEELYNINRAELAAKISEVFDIQVLPTDLQLMMFSHYS